MISRQRNPDNLEFPFHSLDSFLTPNELFYVRTHFDVPELDAKTWKLKVEGAVNKPLEIGYDELVKMPSHTQTALLEAIMDGGDALIEDQDARGMLVFRKKDGSTWGDIYMPWTYSRWVRAYGLIRDAMPPDRRARWEKALALGFDGISRTALHRVHNIPAHHAMALYHAGQLLDRPEWRRQATEFMAEVAQGNMALLSQAQAALMQQTQQATEGVAGAARARTGRAG